VKTANLVTCQRSIAAGERRADGGNDPGWRVFAPISSSVT